MDFWCLWNWFPSSSVWFAGLVACWLGVDVWDFGVSCGVVLLLWFWLMWFFVLLVLCCGLIDVLFAVSVCVDCAGLMKSLVCFGCFVGFGC